MGILVISMCDMSIRTLPNVFLTKSLWGACLCHPVHICDFTNISGHISDYLYSSWFGSTELPLLNDNAWRLVKGNTACSCWNVSHCGTFFCHSWCPKILPTWWMVIGRALVPGMWLTHSTLIVSGISPATCTLCATPIQDTNDMFIQVYSVVNLLNRGV